MITGSSIAQKQTVAMTSFLLILFIVTHLASNLLIYAGPAVFNSYAHIMHSLGPLLLIPRILLFIIFILHIFVICTLIIQNIKARGGLKRYAIVQVVGQRRLAERFMAWSGAYILVFVIFHIFNFVLADQQGANSFIDGKRSGLYGLVYNYFTNPLHDVLYILAMLFLGLHLSHGVQSMIQTFGFGPKWAHVSQKHSDLFALCIFLGYSSIPIYVYWMSH